MTLRSMAGSANPTILMLTEREEALVSVRSLLAREGYNVLVAAEGAAALALFVRCRADVFLVEQAMIDADTGELLRRLRALDDGVPVVVSGRSLDPANRRRLIRRFDLHGIYDPDAGSSALLELIESALASSRCMRGARTARELRDLVLAQFCHEVRNSLHVIRGYTEILRGDPGTHSMERSAEDVLDRLGVAGDTALGLAHDYLELARLEAPGTTVRREVVDIDALLDDLRVLSGRQIGTRPVQFTTEVPFPGAVMCSDGEKIRATLAQLLTNAIKFTPSGEVRLTVRAELDHTDFILADAGSGIAPDALPDILSPAYQFRNDVAATVPGQGVGLAIALRLSALIGAALTATSDSSGGAVFTLSVPGVLDRRAEAYQPTLH